MRFLLRAGMCMVVLWGTGVQARILDPESEANPALAAIATTLETQGLDVAFNLNLRELAARHPERPRVGQLADIPAMTMPLSRELLHWEEAVERGDIGVLALLPAGEGLALSQAIFYEHWLAAAPGDRILISYVASDAELAATLAAALGEELSVLFLAPGAGQVPEQAGRLFAVAGQRWVLDSVAARDYRSEIPEFQYLGESLRRNSDSVLNPDSRANRRLASAEPAVFLKESLGDEFEASTIPEIIVPGGIALGEATTFTVSNLALSFEQQSLWLTDHDGVRFSLPQEALPLWKAAYDFSARSTRIGSDAIVDIDERGRVRISAALEDTDLGYEMVRIDTEPFNYVRRLDVLKSVILDNRVQFESAGPSMHFTTDYEVRFLQADRMRIARTQAAIVYRYRSVDDSMAHIDSWGPEAFKLEGRTDFDGLGESTLPAARYAAWIALFRSVHDQTLPFTYGRYEFLKLEKAGRATPARM